MENNTTTAPNIINGVNIDRLVETINAVKAQPELGMFRFRLSNKWINGGHNRSTIKDFFGAGKEDTTRSQSFVYDNDEPDVLLGTDNSPNPVEFVLHGLAGCLTTSMCYHASALGYKIDSIESQFEGDLDLQGFLGISKNVRNGYDNIRISFKIEGDLTEDQKKEILKLGPEFSPVFDIVTNKVPVQVTLETN